MEGDRLGHSLQEAGQYHLQLVNMKLLQCI